MSASLSTLRLFFRAVAPKLLSSSGRSKDTASVVGTNEAIVPFGRTGSESKTPRSRPAQYSHFDNSNGGEYALDTFDIQIEAGTTLPSGNYSEIEKSSRPHT